MVAFRHSSFPILVLCGVLYTNAIPVTNPLSHVVASRSSLNYGSLHAGPPASSQGFVPHPKPRAPSPTLGELNAQLAEKETRKKTVTKWLDMLTKQINSNQGTYTEQNGRVVLAPGLESVDLMDWADTKTELTTQHDSLYYELSELNRAINDLRNRIQKAEGRT